MAKIYNIIGDWYMLKIVSIIAITAALSSFAHAEVSDKMISNVMPSDGAAAKVILVDKSNRNMYALNIDNSSFEILHKFPIIYGVNEGDKQIINDGKTPEGVYYITTYRSGETLIKMYGDYAKIYGTGSFPLNYPNPVDKIRKKTGHGIWIHGRDPINGKETTQGCVALVNENLDTLKEDIKIKHPVIVTDNISYLSKEEYELERDKLFNHFSSFINAWQSNNYEKFEKFIHPDYKSRSANAKNYLASKKYLMGVYKDKVILNDSTFALKQNESNIVIDTNQFYCAANLTTYANKRYYFAKNDDALKLIAEESFPLDASAIIKNDIMKFVSEWADSWRAQDIDKYIGFYSKSFRNKESDLDGWRSYKSRIFEKNENINLDIAGISWSVSGNKYNVSFKQSYSSGNISDYGTKTLELDGCPTQFKITSETWTAN